MRSKPSATAATSSRSSLECAAAREAPTEMRTSGVVEVSDGLIVRVVGHSDPADALAAVAKPRLRDPQFEWSAPPTANTITDADCD